MNTIKIDLNELDKQIDIVNESNIDTDAKEGLHNLLGTIMDLADEYELDDSVEFVMVVK